jgi:murein DD-endopeptidase MepM/ murein hydrolase activator NlpD
MSLGPVLAVAAAALLLGASASAQVAVRLEPRSVAQGTASLLVLRASGMHSPQLWLVPPGADAGAGRSVTVAPAGPGRYVGLLGVDLDEPAGNWRLELRWMQGAELQPQSQQVPVEVRAKAYPVQRLTLPPSKTDPDAEALRRIEQESAAAQATFARLSPLEQLGPLVHPLARRPPGSRFGSRRIINGEPRAQHSGADYKAATGTPVRSMAAGTVALAADHFFAGRSVYVDHGGGFVSMYFHLDEIGVREGQRVQAGERVGTVGATGRVTGPHLHLGVRLGGARVDPDSVLALSGLIEAAP